MVFVRLIGGLGNQMFQYAAGLALARRLGVEMALDLRAFERYRVWSYVLDRLRVSARVASRSELWRWPVAAGPAARRSGWLRRALNWYVPPDVSFDARFMELKDGVLLDGYFQSERYFDSVGDVLLREFQPVTPLSPENLALVEAMRSTHSVAVHVRRGDYVTNPSAFRVHGVCSPAYYESAVQAFRERGVDPKFFVFSDDPEWVRSGVNVGEGAVYVEGHQKFPELDLHLMSQCSSFIISNSTFSWWAAWLGTRRVGAGQVIAPHPWFADAKMEPRGLVPPQWRLLPR